MTFSDGQLGQWSSVGMSDFFKVPDSFYYEVPFIGQILGYDEIHKMYLSGNTAKNGMLPIGRKRNSINFAICSK